MKDNRLEGNIVYVEAPQAHSLQIFDEQDNWKRFATYQDNLFINTAGKEVILREWVNKDYSTYKGRDRKFTTTEWKAVQGDDGNREKTHVLSPIAERPGAFRAAIFCNPSDEPLTIDLQNTAGSVGYDLAGQAIKSVSLSPWESQIIFLVLFKK
jgi:hypothetical protein